jgi:hypothetical protein
MDATAQSRLNFGGKLDTRIHTLESTADQTGSQRHESTSESEQA